MSHLLAISPHLDDAAFSIGGTLAAHVRAGGRVTVLTCFTGNVARPTGFALACQRDKGLADDVDYMALRRAEDEAACAVIGAEAIHLPFLEAPHRGYACAVALFGARRGDDAIVAPLAEALADAIARLAPDRIAGPLAIGGHVDHVVVREALARATDTALLWEDWPYADRHALSPSAEPAQRTVLDDGLRAARHAMCAAYATQIGFQFGDAGRLAARLAGIGEERLYGQGVMSVRPAR
ncbi:PIG-L deacetylase family protein [Sphingomonas solaris]|uniref:PIG-L deacetylase family protein n=1 Tax=Alterirhizorhabdus solaris TaxID=2529389 RepID=UPI001396AE2B|nr:PIG-L family deacetylase [Sphingomonas solaris]